MQTLLALAALVAVSTLPAQSPEGSLQGPSSVVPNADGTIGNSPIIRDQQQPGPEVPDGSTSGPIFEPQQDGCVTLNPGGGTLDTSSWTSSWFVHRVVAPRNMTVQSFDFFCAFTTGSSSVNTALYLDSSGQPASSPVRTGTMSVNTTAGFRRTTLSSSYYLSKGTVFYIGYQVPDSNFRVSLTGGSNGTYFWNPPTWSGPFATRKFAWRVNCYDEGRTWTFGTSCNTSASNGEGMGTWSAALNADATTNDSTGWVTGGGFQHRFVAPRDMFVDGASILCHLTSGSASVPVRMYLGNGTSNSPGTLVRSGTMTVTSSVDWHRARFSSGYFVGKGDVFYLGYEAPANFRVSTDDGSNTTYYYLAPSASSWTGPFSTRKFAVRCHTRYCDGENLSASGNATNTYVNDATFMHRQIAESDRWISGFGFRCSVASGSVNVNFTLRLAAPDGKPEINAIRSVTRSVSSTSTYYDVHFTPVFVPRGAIYYVGYTIPSSTSAAFYPAASGSSTYTTSYYWRNASTTAWSGPFNPVPFAYRVYCARTQLNPYTDAVASTTFSSDAYFVFRTVAPDDMWIEGYEHFAGTVTGSATVSSLLYLDNSGQPGSLVRTGTMNIDSSADWSKTVFSSPYFVKQGTVFYVGIRTPNSATVLAQLRASSGSNATYFWRPSSASSWNGSFTTPTGYKVFGHTGAGRLVYSGIPDIGGSFSIKLVGASTNKPFGLLLSASNSQWGPVPLPWAIPFWSGCSLYVGYDTVLVTGLTSSQGSASVTLPVPNSIGLIHVQFYNQYWVLEQISGSSFEMSWTNGGGVRIGG